jgi:hypothetical protein
MFHPDTPHELRHLIPMPTTSDQFPPATLDALADAALSLGWQPGAEGVFLGVPEAAYHKAPGVSHSILKHMDPTPAHCLQYLKDNAAQDEDEAEENMALLIGSLVHHAVLTPELPLPKIVLQPETYPAPATHADVKKGTIPVGHPLPWHSRAKVCETWHEEQVKAGKIVMTKTEWQTTEGCVRALSAHPFVRQVMLGGYSEVSGFLRFRNASGEALRKWRIDHVPKGNALFDIKTVARKGDASPEEFAKIMGNRGYATQAAYYRDNWNECEGKPWLPSWWQRKEYFIFAVVEKVPPYAVAIYQVDEAAMEAGTRLNWQRLACFMQATKTETWTGYEPKPVLLNLPRYEHERITKVVSGWLSGNEEAP